MRARFQVIGTSHVEAIRRVSERSEVHVINLDQDVSAAKAFETNLSGRLIEAPDFVFLAIGGVAASIYGLIENEVPFSVGDAMDGQIPDGDRFFIAEQLIYDFFQHQQVVRYDRISQLVELYRNKAIVTCLAPPPPRGGSRDRKSLSKPDGYVRLDTPGRFRSILNRGFTPPTLRKKLYDIDMALFRTFCTTQNIDLIEAPSAALDEIGLLDENFSIGDPVHGNERYGALVISQLYSYMAEHDLSLISNSSHGHEFTSPCSDCESDASKQYTQANRPMDKK